MVILIPVSIVAERQLWHDVFHHGHAVVLKLVGALAIDVFILTLTTTLACLLPMSDFGYYVYVALMFSDRRLGLSLVQGTCTCMLLLSFTLL